MGALPEELADSELFGHRRGAFTGADRSRLGAFRAAHGGTLFLDELGNLSPRLQVKLLRVLQERRVQPVGEDAPVPVDVRLVAATNADLGAMVRRGTFRADLLGRLDAATLRLPPLRERVEDLDELAAGLLGERVEPWCTPEARSILQSWRWPGNIRELGNVLRYAAAVCPPGQPLAPEHLGPLSPRNRRRVPTLLVSDGATAGWGLEPRQITALTATTLRVPPLRDRGEEALRAAVLRGLGGRPIEPAALDLLARLPWWGNHAELGALFAAIEALPPGPVDRGALVGLVPQVLDATAQAPIFIVLLPDLDETGRLTGLVREVSAGAALLGRASSLRALAGPDPRTRAALAAIEALAGPRGVAAVDLSLVPQLSRAHVLVTRSELGLEVHAIPGAALPVHAGCLSEEELVPCIPGHPVPIRSAGEIRVDGRSGEPVLRAWAFLGEVALAEHGPVAAARHAAARAALDRTQAATEPVAAAPAANGTLSTRVWTLTPEEQAALVAMLCAYEGGQLKAHVAEALAGWREAPALRRLARYLDEAPRLSQYLVRLVEHEDNGAVRAELAARLLALPDADTRLDLLPKGLREAVLAAMNA